MNIEQYAAACQRLSTIDLTGYADDAEITSQLDGLAAGCGAPLYGPERDYDQIWFRGVPCDSADGLENLKACIYRPRGSLDNYGRAHVPNGKSIFYASWNILTVVRELDLLPGQFRQIIAVRPKHPLRFQCFMVGDATHVFNSGSSLVNSVPMVRAITGWFRNATYEQRLRLLLYDGFLINQFRISGNSRYRLTALFAKKVMGTGAGLMYPSVQSQGAINLAVRSDDFDKIFEVMETRVVAVKKLAFGVYMIEEKRYSCDFDSSGTINGASTRRLPSTDLPFQGLRFANDIVGWRVPKSNHVPPPG